MNIEDLVYKTGRDGKPRKPKKTAKSASNFTAAVKAELDAKQSAVDMISKLSGSDRLGARLNDAKGQPKVCTICHINVALAVSWWEPVV